jgi:predicted MPP superfamily phosphohydrolase
VTGLGAVVLLAAYAEAYHRGPGDLRVSLHEIGLDDVGAGGERLRILHLSDIQTGGVGAHEDRAIRQAMALAPDLVVLTGDYVHPRLGGDRARIAADLRALLTRRGFRAPLGVYAVRGDVDRDWPEVLAGTGITPLSGELARVELPGGRGLTLIGLTPGMSRGHNSEALLRLARSAPPGDLRIALGHNPDYVRILARRVPVDLALAGHTHGGQVVLPFFGPPYTKSVLPRRHASGLHDYDGVPLHVTRGVGMERGTAPQIRFLCPPEICLLEIRYRRNR